MSEETISQAAPAVIVRRAAELLRSRAERASTGEAWQASRHYDALYIVDLKPSLGDHGDVAWQDAQLDIPSVMSYEQPRFHAMLHEHAEYVAMMNPLMGLLLAQILENTAALMDESYDRITPGSECVHCPAGACTCPPDLSCTRCGRWYDEQGDPLATCQCWTDLITVSRLLLGESCPGR